MKNKTLWLMVKPCPILTPIQNKEDIYFFRKVPVVNLFPDCFEEVNRKEYYEKKEPSSVFDEIREVLK